MSHVSAARGARQTAVLAAIVGLHFAVYLVVALGLIPRDPPKVTDTVPIRTVPRNDEKLVVEKPTVELLPGPTVTVARPDVNLPDFAPVANDSPNIPLTVDPGAGSVAGTDGIVLHVVPPKLRTRPASVAAAINACYPPASRRLNEEGTVVALVTIGAAGSAVNWSVARSSGFARLDAAIACVLGKLDFVAGRRDGQAVSAEALLPIVFRLD